MNKIRYLLFDGGDTLIRTYPGAIGPMVNWPVLEAVPGVVETLNSLRLNWNLAVATNAVDSGETEIRLALDRVSLGRFFNKIYCFRSIGYKKPAPEFFQFIFNDLQLEPARLVMVGDSWEADVLGAIGSGLRAIWFNEHTQELRVQKGVQTIHSFHELPKALSMLESKDSRADE